MISVIKYDCFVWIVTDTPGHQGRLSADCPLPYKVCDNTFAMLNVYSMFCTTIMRDDLRFIDYRIPPEKSSATTYLSFLFFKSICNIMSCQIAAYVANMGSLRVSVMTESLLHTLLSIYKTKSFLQVYGIAYLTLESTSSYDFYLNYELMPLHFSSGVDNNLF